MRVQFDKVVNLYHNGVEQRSAIKEVIDLAHLTEAHTITISDMMLYVSECKYDFDKDDLICNHYRLLKGNVDDWDNLMIYLLTKYSCKCL
jgi:hypothetical protein